MQLKPIIAAMSLMAVLPAMAVETTVDFGYGSADNTHRWGTKRAETFDIAIHVNDPRLVGKTIESVSIPVINSGNISDYSVWMSTELKVSISGGVRKNNPNVCSKAVVPDGNVINATFDTPYTITEDGVYVGYTFTVTKEDDATNAPVVLTGDVGTGGLYLRSSVYFTRWEDRSEYVGGSSAMTVKIKGDFPEASMAIRDLDFINVEKGKTFMVPAVVRNTCGQNIESFDYEYDINGKTGAGHVDFDKPLKPLYNAVRALNLEIASLDELDDHDLKVKITKVNGEVNADPDPNAETLICGLPMVPVHRVLMEEYTGSWCGNCVRGIAGIELMEEKYPDTFVAVVYHNSDQMHMQAGYPDREEAKLPGCAIDRKVYTDPYFGDNVGQSLGIEPQWLGYQQEFTPVSLDVTASWSEDNPNIVEVTSHTFWAKTPEDTDASKYRIEYVLLADDLSGSGETWMQQNWLSGSKDCDGMEGLDQFVNAPMEMYNFKYHDVAIATSGLMGCPESVTDVTQFSEETHKFQFDISNIYNVYGRRIVPQRDKLHVAAMVLYHAQEKAKYYGDVVNAGKCGTVYAAGMEDVMESEVIATEYYDLCGVRTKADAKGVVVKVTRHANGVSTASKVINK